MKGFANGIGGVCICMLAIMGTVLCGFALGGEEQETTTTQYSLTADTTGLFDTSKGPAFTDYNPAANWTGYRAKGSYTTNTLGGVEYSVSAKINSYPIPEEGTQSGKNYFSEYASSNNDRYADPPGLWTGDWVGGRTIIISDDLVGMTKQTSYVLYPRVKTVEQFLFSSSMLTYDYLDVSLINSVEDISVRAWAAPSSEWQLQTFNTSSGSVPSYVTWMMLPLEETSKTVMLRVYPVEDIVIGLDSDGNERFRSTMANTTVAFQQMDAYSVDSKVMYNKTTWAGVDIDPGFSFWYYGYTAGTQAYMDVSKGVVPIGTASTAETLWSNGYQNGKIDMLIRWNADASSTRTFMSVWIPVTVAEAGGGTSTMDIYANVEYQNGRVRIETFNMSLSKPVVTNYYAGNFTNGILMSIDMYGDALRAYAVDSFRSFQNYTLLSQPIIEVGSFFTDISGRSDMFTPGILTASAIYLGTGDANTRPTIGIVDTSVYMGDSTLIMSEPEIKPTELWPDMEAWELRLYSFAIEGWAISIRNSDYIMASWLVEDGKITIDGTAHTLSNFRIRAVHNTDTSKWDLYVVFGDETPLKPIYIMSATGDGPKIYMYGNWYFQSSIYEGTNVTTTSYNFDFQHFIFDSNAAILAYMGLLIMGSIVAKRMGGLGVYDMIVLVFAGICGFVLMV